MMSGSAVTAMNIVMYNDINRGSEKMIKKLSCDHGNDDAATLKCMQSKTTEELVAADELAVSMSADNGAKVSDQLLYASTRNRMSS